MGSFEEFKKKLIIIISVCVCVCVYIIIIILFIVQYPVSSVDFNKIYFLKKTPKTCGLNNNKNLFKIYKRGNNSLSYITVKSNKTCS